MYIEKDFFLNTSAHQQQLKGKKRKFFENNTKKIYMKTARNAIFFNTFEKHFPLIFEINAQQSFTIHAEKLIL